MPGTTETPQHRALSKLEAAFLMANITPGADSPQIAGWAKDLVRLAFPEILSGIGGGTATLAPAPLASPLKHLERAIRQMKRALSQGTDDDPEVAAATAEVRLKYAAADCNVFANSPEGV